MIYRTRLTLDDEEEWVSTGKGVEQDTMSALFKTYFVDYENLFCTSAFENYTTILTAPLISDRRREQLTIFGAVTALSLIYGSYPGRLNPLLLIYLLNKCDLQCLYRDLVFQICPSLGQTLDSWLRMGATDRVDNPSLISHFSSYHNTSVCAPSCF